MILKHKIDAFLYAIFPQMKGLSVVMLERFFVMHSNVTEFAFVGKFQKRFDIVNYYRPIVSFETPILKRFLNWLYLSWAGAVPEQLEKMVLKFQVARNIEKE